jgi:hypothetical protein
MLTFEQRKAAFVDLGHLIGQLIDQHSLKPSETQPEFQNILSLAKAENQWFTIDNVCFALNEWRSALTTSNLDQWLKQYELEDHQNDQTIGIVMAGNIPLVGFHDFLSVLICGFKVIIKQSSNDKRLLLYLANKLIDIQPEFKNKIEFTDGRLENFDAVIATGSNNTARYFEYYFRNKPHIIRRNRNGVGILTGNETKEDFKNLGQDIFKYFGLGCRNVSKLYVPKGYDFKTFFESLSEFEPVIQHNKYANNYDYNKAVYLMSDIKFLDNGFLILKEDEGFSTPIGVLNYEVYEDDTQLKQSISSHKNNIQCIVGRHKIANFTFGKAQQPKLADYADGVDTINFLKHLPTKITL